MAVKLSANYSKKIGLPNYSSHSFMASVEIELTDLSQVESECQRLYELLQQSVDREIQQVGFLPDTKGHAKNGVSNGNGHVNGSGYRNGSNGHTNGNGSNGHHRPATNGNGNSNGDRWVCTEGQRGFILRIINEQQLDKQEVEDLAGQMFGLGVKQLNKMQASQLIDELLAKAGKPRQSRWSNTATQPA
ncbi:hypothetical protein FEM03_05840 [Phragmitibacter flavus]|uniref:Uncharacterized protein n=1 Tax=Phragmitibacter flavus TaxID=2576071 RepID=A0A5R8KH65_9BACT|nr:hypothetical protein [Phragmitibacter flavus]TLD71658.1 hypothetical protein FEM03_05840 [Phragmitibacter flavus]